MKETLRAVHSAEVRAFFAALGLLPQLDAGELRCDICGDPIGESHFRAAVRRQERLLLACDKPGCALALAGIDIEVR